MSIYMLQDAYTAQAWQNLVTKPEDRRVAIGGVVKAAGGRLLDLYFVFGENDLV
ncbi:MAG: GYD domain-containing protein, partial [Chloroflexi bacterium]|nr:GYD domain-containing protein [Chloroflexota bacterium]